MTPEIESALNEVANSLGVSPNSLRALIQFESRWNPKAKNPTSSARGLIQFMDSTARSMGFQGSQDLINQYPDTVSQLKGPVKKYLSQFKPYTNDQSLFMAVFYPVARKWDLNKNFPENVRKANPGIDTVGDYVNHVYRVAGISKEQKIGLGLGSLLILFFISKTLFKG